MWSLTRSAFRVVSAAAFLGLLLPAVLAHGDDAAMDMGDGVPMAADEPLPDSEYPPSYFSHLGHRGHLVTHIVLMVLAWVFILPLGEWKHAKGPSFLFWRVCVLMFSPIATMFSLARSRYTLPTQSLFIAANALGVLFSTIYNGKTPDLYPNNAHHKLGWLVTWVLSAQVVISLLGRVGGAFNKTKGQNSLVNAQERQSFIPVSLAAMDEHHRFHSDNYSPLYRHSNDSGQGTEPNTESVRSSSFSSSPETLASPTAETPRHKEFVEDEDDDLEADLPAVPRGGAMRNLVTKVGGKISSRAWKVLIFAYNFVDRTSIILGFITLATGIVALGRFFVSNAVILAKDFQLIA